jgi:hypothetical protein
MCRWHCMIPPDCMTIVYMAVLLHRVIYLQLYDCSVMNLPASWTQNPLNDKTANESYMVIALLQCMPLLLHFCDVTYVCIDGQPHDGMMHIRVMHVRFEILR